MRVWFWASSSFAPLSSHAENVATAILSTRHHRGQTLRV
jgi:hypothetical protein